MAGFVIMGMVSVILLLFWLLPTLGVSEEHSVAPPLKLNNLAGKQQHITDFNDKVTLVHFWATWCTSCRREIPALLKTAQDFQSDGLKLIMVAADSHAEVKAYLEQNALEIPILLIDQYGGAMRNYHVRGLPATYLINKKGKIQKNYYGAVEWRAPEVTTFLSKFLE